MDLTVDLNVQTDCAETSDRVEQALIQPEEWQGWFREWLIALHPTQSPINAYALSLCLTGDGTIRELNASFRQIDRPTDVLAFASLESETLPQQIWNSQPLELGDIIISTETAERQAVEQSHPLRHELAWLASHGLLHLLGWDHPTSATLDQMLSQQRKLLSLVGLQVK